MSLKSIDLQMAYHRNGDAGIKQNQLMHKPIADQALLAGQTAKRAERELQKPVGAEEPQQAKIGKDGRNFRDGGADSRPKKERRQNGKAPDTPRHPYKGHHIDLTL
jgi:hypothetical protein